MEMMLIYMKCLMIVLIVREKNDLVERSRKRKGKVIFNSHVKNVSNQIEKLTEGINQATAAN